MIGTIKDDDRSYSRVEDKKSYLVQNFKELFAPKDTEPMSFGD